MYAPDSLICNSDLEEVAKRAHSISDVETLVSFLHLPHEDKLALPLFSALVNIITEICGPFPVSTPHNPTPTLVSQTNNTSTVGVSLMGKNVEKSRYL